MCIRDSIVAAALDRLHIFSGLTGNAELIVVPDQPAQPLQTPEEDPLLFTQQLVHQKRIVRSACGLSLIHIWECAFLFLALSAGSAWTFAGLTVADE